MRSDRAQSHPDPVTSLRTRWNRGFTLPTAIVILSGLASFIGTQLLVDTFRSAAVRVERETTISATLRADVVAHVVVVASPITGDQQRQVDALQTAVRAGFTQAIGNETTTAAKELLLQSLAEWQAIVDAAGPPDARADQATMGAAVSARAPKMLDLLDQAGSTSRAAVRVDLANAARLDHQVMIVLAVLELLAVGLAVRLARRLSTEVLRPVGILRDSANHLAAGRLDHRVVVDRADELGELAVSFNAMADAIAGSQRSLTREANTDSLTGLANRAAFRARLAATLARPNRRGGNQAVLFVDIDDFKDVNDTLGHAAGDELLRVAAERGELVLDYQPVVDLETGALVGLEALVRWLHPTQGLLPPSAFIDVAEETGAIIGIGAWVLATATHQVHCWQRRYGLPGLWISVNVSVCELDVPGFADVVENGLRVSGLDPTRLVLEVTESMVADPKGGAAAALAALRRIGVRVALDDFGTRHSSISYLRQLPVDLVKIDRSFVAGTHTGGPGNDLLEAIVAMAQRLGLDIIPEGIEDLDQLARLRVMGCHIGQGFLLSRPVSTEAIDALLAAPTPLPHVGLSGAVTRPILTSAT